MQRAAITTPLRLSFSLHCAHLPPHRLRGMSSIHNTNTHTQPPTLVFRHVGCSTSRDQRPVGSSPAHSPVSLLRCRAVRAFCSPSSTPPISSHATQPLLPVSQGTRGSTGAVQQATCVRLWGRPGHAPSSPLREEALPRMCARMGRCERVRM